MSIPLINFAIEKGFRIFKNETVYFHFFMIEVSIEKDKIHTGNYSFLLKDKQNKQLLSKRIYIDILNERIVTNDSHEDPLVCTDSHYLICFQIEHHQLQLLQNLNAQISFIDEQYSQFLIKNHDVPSMNSFFNRYQKQHYSTIINNFNIISKKPCVLHLHLGKHDGSYYEQEFILSENTAFNFRNFVKNHAYVGVQCSYEKEYPEVEEKHIVIGQKGMALTGVLFDGKNYHYPPLSFNNHYASQYIMDVQHVDNNYINNYCQEDWKECNTIFQLVEYYMQPEVKKYFFESNFDFLFPHYSKNNTYGCAKVYSSLPAPKKIHFDLDVCRSCPLKTQCLQAVPSALSYSLFKMNIAKDENQYCDCIVYKMLQNVVSLK